MKATRALAADKMDEGSGLVIGMRKRGSAGPSRVLLGLVLLLVWGAAPAAASAPEGVVIELETRIGSGMGTFEATGAIQDEGTFAFSSSHVHGNFTQVTSVHVVMEFTGIQGTFTALLQSLIEVGPPCVWADQGRWVIVSGTGTYAGLQGTGVHDSELNICTGEAPAVWHGSVHTHS